MRGLWGSFWFRTLIVMIAGSLIVCAFHYTIGRVGFSLIGKTVLPLLAWAGTEVYIGRSGRSAPPLLSYILFVTGCEISLVQLSGLAFNGAVLAYAGHLDKAVMPLLITLVLSLLASLLPAAIYGWIWQRWLRRPDNLSHITKRF